MGKSIKEVMTPSPTTVEPDASVVEAARTMRERDTGIVPVVENGKLIGQISRKDILCAALEIRGQNWHG